MEENPSPSGMEPMAPPLYSSYFKTFNKNMDVNKKTDGHGIHQNENNFLALPRQDPATISPASDASRVSLPSS